jgi:hypothetical protein
VKRTTIVYPAVVGMLTSLALAPAAGARVQVCRVKVRCSSRWKSCPGKGRPGRVAIPAAMEVTKWSKPGRQKAALGRLQVGRP